MNIGEQIRNYRKKAGISQKELGERLGVSQQHIAQYENGKRIPKIETIQKIADALKVDTLEVYQVEKGPHDIGPILSKAIIKTDKMDEVYLLNYYRQLNEAGKTEAHKRVGELTLLDIYKNTETLQHMKIKYNPDVPYNISELNASYDELYQQDRPDDKKPDKPPQD